MANLCDHIEEYLKRLLAISPRRYIDIQRRELANKFDCVPSQINYVLNTRFSLDRGYLVESKRGGRGFIRIYRPNPIKIQSWSKFFDGLEGEEFEPRTAVDFIARVYEEKYISRREAQMLTSLLQEEPYLPLADPDIIKQLQGKLFETVLKIILKD